MIRFAPALLFAMFAIGAAPVPRHLMKPNAPAYYPTTSGTKLVYNRDGTDEIRVIAKVEVTEKGKLVTTEELENGLSIPFHTVLLTEKGVFILERAGTTYAAPFEMIRLPFKAGNEWQEIEGSVTNGTRKAIREEKITVAAGEFNCIRVESRSQQGNKTTHWYAAGIGVVKVDYGNSTLELKSIAPGKP